MSSIISFLCFVLITVNGNVLKHKSKRCAEAPTSCVESGYRSLDGSCNNLEHRGWGMANRPYGDLVGFHYADGRHELARALSGNTLPGARRISFGLFSKDFVDHNHYNLLALQYGQIIAQDMAFSLNAPQTGLKPTACCANGKLTENVKQKDKCAPILVPPDDPVFGPRNISCFELTRTVTTYDCGCSGPHEVAKPMSAVTSWMDLSFVYGNSEEENVSIRTSKCGTLKNYTPDGQDWPRRFGNVEISLNPQLPPLRVVWWLEHNRVAETLCVLNPRWTDERIYQEARRRTIAEYQHITYNEYLPTILGEEYAEKMKLNFPKTEECVDDYNGNLDPSVTSEFAALEAYRNYHVVASILDQNIVGVDFRAVGIQRGRDHGLASYVKVRRFCGLPIPKNFEDLINVCKISSKSVEKLKTLYECVEDIDLIVGVFLEPPLPGALSGETYGCILTDTFARSRRGDRFFYQNCAGNKFNPDQLKIIQETTLSTILCSNSEILYMQPKAFQPIHKGNELKHWYEFPPLRIHYWCDKENFPTEESPVDEIEMEVDVEDRSNDTTKLFVLQLHKMPIIEWEQN